MQRGKTLYGPLEESYGRRSGDVYFTSFAVSFHEFASVQIPLAFKIRDTGLYAFHNQVFFVGGIERVHVLSAAGKSVNLTVKCLIKWEKATGD